MTATTATTAATATSTILIADDEPVGRRVLQMLLAGQGYRLVTASNGTEALAQAAALTPDLILLDVMMPDMDGFEVCRRLRDDPLLAEVPVMMVTALDDRDSRLRGIEVGADDFISKPVDRVELRKRVQTIIRLDRYRRLHSERVQRQQAEEETRRRNRELTILNNVITAAASTLDVRDILGIACEALANAFDVPRATALLLDEGQRTASMVAEHLTNPPTDGPPAAQLAAETIALAQTLSVEQVPVLASMVTSRRVVAIEDAQNDERLASLHGLVVAHGVVSVLMVPIVVLDQMVGCIKLCSELPRSFTPSDFSLAQSIATAVGQAMQTAQLYQSLQSHAYYLEDMVGQRTSELRVERDRTHAILEALGEAVIVTDINGMIQYVNPAATAITGFRNEQMVHHNWRILQGASEASGLYEELLASVQAGKTWRGEAVQKHQDGSSYDVALTAAPLFDPHGTSALIGFVTVQRDVTPLKEAERLKDQFVSNVSHELRTPLSIITLLSGNLDTLFDRLEEEKRKKMIRDIREHTQVLNDLITSVLEISRIDSRRISTQHAPVDLAQLMHEEVERQLPLAQKKQQDVQSCGAEHLLVWGNDGQLRQVVRNLCNNAIKYTPTSGTIRCECLPHVIGVDGRREPPDAPEPTEPDVSADVLPDVSADVSSDAYRQTWPGRDHLAAGRWAALRVVDTGIGISNEELPRIFERFYRVQTQGNVPGTGLGLSIAQELVGLHGGTLGVASVAGKGTTVALYIPLWEGTEA